MRAPRVLVVEATAPRVRGFYRANFKDASVAGGLPRAARFPFEARASFAPAA
ncbi:MAG: hypothetical protein ABW020_06845 [Candidatus Rokuibacteriota bacterium]